MHSDSIINQIEQIENSPGSYTKKRVCKLRSLPVNTLTELPFQMDEVKVECISCEICYEKSSSFMALPCGDKICLGCLKLTYEFYIDNGLVSEDRRVCPICSSKLPVRLMKWVLDKKYMAKFQFLLKRRKVDKLVAEKTAIYCPIPDCLGYALLIQDAEVLSCHKCYVSVCAQCNKRYHPLLTCEEYAAEIGEEDMNDLVQSRKWKHCPYCSSIVEKLDGCNCVECYSLVCEGNNTFCYLCGKGLSKLDDPYMHFGEWGSDSRFCNTIKGIQDIEY